MGDNEGGHKRSRTYYKKCMYKKRKKWNSMDVGMQGFLVTCNRNESQAVKEMYNLFNEYAEKLYGPEEYLGLKNKKAEEDGEEKRENSDKDDDDDEEEEDIEAALKKEVSALKQIVPSERRFQQVDSGAKNCLFIKTTLSNPCELIHTILKDVYDTQVQKSRFALRVLPVQAICRANLTDISNLAQDLFEPFFRTPYGTILTYGISFKARMTCKVSRDQVIHTLCQIIGEMNPLNKVNYSNPDLIVLAEVLRGLCCLSVVKDFNKFRKYNLQEAARAQQSVSQQNANSSNKTDKSSTPANSASTGAGDTASTAAADSTPTGAVDSSSKGVVDTASTVATKTASTGAADSTPTGAADSSSTCAVDSTSTAAANTASTGAADSTSTAEADTTSTAAAKTPTGTVDTSSSV